MISENHSDAARINGKLSHGPVTPEGKAISSQNAVKIGFFSRAPIIPGESAEEYEEHRAKMLARLAPADGLEQTIADMLVTDAWRMRRIPHMEAGLLVIQFGEQETEGRPDRAVATALIGASKVGEGFKRLMRYDAMLKRSFNRNMAELKKLQAERKKEAQAKAEEQKQAEAKTPEVRVQNEPSTRVAEPTSSAPAEVRSATELQNEPKPSAPQRDGTLPRAA